MKIWIVIIFILAAVFRIFSLNLIEFKYDEAYTVFQLNQFYQHPYLMQVGPPQSTGVYNPPLFNYLMIFISILSQDPQFLSFSIALINCIFIVVFYLTIRRFYGNMTGVLAALFLATSPWAILFSRKIWIPDLLLPFLIIYFYLLHKLILEKSSKSVLPLFAVLALILQLHASGLFFLVTTLIIFLILRIKINFKKALYGFLLGLIPAIPYFIRQFQTNCIDCRAFFAYQQIDRSFDSQNFLRPFQFFSTGLWNNVLGNDTGLFFKSLPFKEIWPVLPYLFALFPILGLVLVIKYNRKLLFLPLYLIIIPASYFLTKTPSFQHYFVVTMLVVIILAAIFLRHLGKKVAIILVGFLILTNIIFEISFNKFLSEKQVIQGDYGAIYQVTKQFVDLQTARYVFLPNYQELRAYAFVFAQTKVFQTKLDEYLKLQNK